MSKRKAEDVDDCQQNNGKRNNHIRFKLKDLPVVNNINDLIKIGKTYDLYRDFDNVMLWNIIPYLEDMDNLVGMDMLKETIFYQIIYYLQNMHKRDNNEYLHTVIMGGPGTGKTTIAKIIGKIYQKMNILSETGPFRIAYRDDFIAGYLGQTALKTRKLLESCIGGVLFIDEVYSLAPRNNSGDSFSKEALDTLTAFLSEHKNDFCCIAAGYEDDINDCFFSMNEGLRRRFPWVHKIKDYTSLELSKIFVKMVNDSMWNIGVDEGDIVEVLEKNKVSFGYAGGDIEVFLTKCKMVHAKRVFSLNKEHKFVITLEDLENGINMMNKFKEQVKDKSPPEGMYL